MAFVRVHSRPWQKYPITLFCVLSSRPLQCPFLGTCDSLRAQLISGAIFCALPVSIPQDARCLLSGCGAVGPAARTSDLVRQGAQAGGSTPRLRRFRRQKQRAGRLGRQVETRSPVGSACRRPGPRGLCAHRQTASHRPTRAGRAAWRAARPPHVPADWDARGSPSPDADTGNRNLGFLQLMQEMR